MSEIVVISGKTKQEKYQSLLPQIKALVENETDFFANVSNIIAAVKYGMNFFWVGIYFVKTSPQTTSAPFSPRQRERGVRSGTELVLGPFQGTVACTRIGYGKGVCGTAWKKKRTVVVKDVQKFSGHITCSPISRSEIVVPIFNNKNVFAVLDIDSDKLDTFDNTDKKYLEQIARMIEKLF